jgi:hypothetical protein
MWQRRLRAQARRAQTHRLLDKQQFPKESKPQWLMVDSRVVMAPFRHNMLFLKAFSGSLDQCGIIG